MGWVTVNELAIINVKIEIFRILIAKIKSFQGTEFMGSPSTLKDRICKCFDYKKTIQCQKITINRSDLKLYIKEYDEVQDAKRSWHLPLTVLISLFIALATTNFQPSVSIPFLDFNLSMPDGMRTVLWAATIVFSVWTAVAIVRALRSESPFELLLKKIDKSILNRPDRTSVFVIKREVDGEVKLLVEKKASWSCYFLPYVKQAALTEYVSSQKSATTKSLGDKLGVDAANIKIDLLQEFNFKSEKFDPPQNVVKEYHFEIFHVKIFKKLLPDGSFTVGDRDYEWRTLNELESDVSTKRNNKDIMNQLRDNYNDLVLNVGCHDA